MSDATVRRWDPLAWVLAALSRFAGSPGAETLGLRKPAERVAYALTRSGFRAVTETARTFRAAGTLLRPTRPGAPEPRGDLFDPRPTEEQRMIQEGVRQLAGEVLRPAADVADEACSTPQEVLEAAGALGLGAMVVPQALGGAGGERSPLTSALVAEELARGDMGIAVSILAPVGVAHALSTWGTADQQERYLPSFSDEIAFPASLAIAEPRPLFDPFRLAVRARREGSDFVLEGTKCLVPLAERAEIFLVAAELAGTGPSLFVVERATSGLVPSVDPGMGVRAAGLGRLELRGARVPARSLLGDGQVPYEELVDLSRLGWCALATGTAQAVLDYVIPYVNERVAFGEPISNRQSVAFLVANIAIELESMRLLTWRAANRAERGRSFHRETVLARTLATEKAMEIGTNGVQLLGGHGFIKDHPVERWYRDLRAVGLMEGGVLL